MNLSDEQSDDSSKGDTVEPTKGERFIHRIVMVMIVVMAAFLPLALLFSFRALQRAGSALAAFIESEASLNEVCWRFGELALYLFLTLIVLGCLWRSCRTL